MTKEFPQLTCSQNPSQRAALDRQYESLLCDQLGLDQPIAQQIVTATREGASNDEVPDDHGTARELIEAHLRIAQRLSESFEGSNAEALQIGRSIQRLINIKISTCFEEFTDDLLAEIKSLLEANALQIAKPGGTYLKTDDMAQRLGLSPVTIQRLFRRGDIDATQTKGGQWRTTASRLRNSKYLKGRKRNGSTRAQSD